MNKTNSVSPTISILGCGWYGLALAERLSAQNYSVKGSTTSPEKLDLLAQKGIQPYLVNFQESQISYHPDFFNCETLIIAIPPKRNTAEQATFTVKVSGIIEAAHNGIVKNIIFISSTAVYGNENDTITEATPTNPETESGHALVASEKLLLSNVNFRTTILRFSGLVGPGRDPGRFFAGKTAIPNGRSPINLIHLEDCIGLTMEIIRQDAFGYIFNASSPDHLSKQEFYTQAAIRSGLTTPVFIDELKTWKVVSSHLVPSMLKYKYLIDNWTEWLSTD